MTTELKSKLELLKGEEVFLRQVSKYRGLVKADYGKIKDISLEIYHPSIGTVPIELEDGLLKDLDMMKFLESVDLILYNSVIVRILMACGINIKPKYNLLDYKSVLYYNDSYVHIKVDAPRMSSEYYYKEFKNLRDEKYDKDAQELNNIGVFISQSKYLNIEDVDLEKIKRIAIQKSDELRFKKSQFKYVYNVDPDNKLEVVEFIRRELNNPNFDFKMTGQLMYLAEVHKHLKNFVDKLIEVKKLKLKIERFSNLNARSFHRRDRLIVMNIADNNELSTFSCVRTNPSKHYYLMFDYKTYEDRLLHFINTGEDLSSNFVKSITEKFMGDYSLLKFKLLNTAVTVKEYQLDGEEIKDYFFKGLEDYKDEITKISRRLPYSKTIKEIKPSLFMNDGLDKLINSLTGFEITIAGNYKNRLILKVSNNLNPYETIKRVYDIFNTKESYGIEFFNGCSVGHDMMEVRMNYNDYSRYGTSKLDYNFACKMLESKGNNKMSRIVDEVMEDLAEN